MHSVQPSGYHGPPPSPCYLTTPHLLFARFSAQFLSFPFWRPFVLNCRRGGKTMNSTFIQTSFPAPKKHLGSKCEGNYKRNLEYSCLKTNNFPSKEVCLPTTSALYSNLQLTAWRKWYEHTRTAHNHSTVVDSYFISGHLRCQLLQGWTTPQMGNRRQYLE